MKHPSLFWIGVTLTATGLGTGKTRLVYVGLALALAGYVGKERILQELPADVRRQITDAIQGRDVSSLSTGTVARELVPGHLAGVTPGIGFEPPLFFVPER